MSASHSFPSAGRAAPRPSRARSTASSAATGSCPPAARRRSRPGSSPRSSLCSSPRRGAAASIADHTVAEPERHARDASPSPRCRPAPPPPPSARTARPSHDRGGPSPDLLAGRQRLHDRPRDAFRSRREPPPHGRRRSLALKDGCRRSASLVSSSYPSLQPGYYIVFSGIFASLEEAQSSLDAAKARVPGGLRPSDRALDGLATFSRQQTIVRTL